MVQLEVRENRLPSWIAGSGIASSWIKRDSWLWLPPRRFAPPLLFQEGAGISDQKYISGHRYSFDALCFGDDHRSNVDQYIRSLIPERDDVLKEMEDRAERERIPIIGPVVGTLLSQLARAINAKRIAELGSAIGYSTIWLARAIPQGGSVLYTDGSAANAKDAAGYFERARINDRIEIRVGDALESFSRSPRRIRLHLQ
jgi:hypothetical protein